MAQLIDKTKFWDGGGVWGGGVGIWLASQETLLPHK